MKVGQKILLGLTTVSMVGCGIAALVVTSKVAAVALLAFAAIALIALVGFGIKELTNYLKSTTTKFEGVDLGNIVDPQSTNNTSEIIKIN